MEILKFQKARLQKNQLIIDESTTIDEWKELGQSLKQVEGSVQFWIGDWARFGEKKGFTGKYVSPKVYDELEVMTGYSRESLKTMKHVAEKVDPAQRFEDVSYSHHQIVASLEQSEQIHFLQKSSVENLTKRELIAEVKEYKQLKNQDNDVKVETTQPEKKNLQADYSQINQLRELDRKSDAEKEIITLAKKIKKEFKKDTYQIFIQVFTNSLLK